MKKFLFLFLCIICVSQGFCQEEKSSIEFKILGKEQKSSISHDRYRTNIILIYSIKNESINDIDSIQGLLTFVYRNNEAIESAVVEYKKKILAGETIYSLTETLPMYEDEKYYPGEITDFVRDNIKKDRLLIQADLSQLSWDFVLTDIHFSKK